MAAMFHVSALTLFEETLLLETTPPIPVNDIRPYIIAMKKINLGIFDERQ
jgi:hypothetical protein